MIPPRALQRFITYLFTFYDWTKTTTIPEKLEMERLIGQKLGMVNSNENERRLRMKIYGALKDVNIDIHTTLTKKWMTLAFTEGPMWGESMTIPRTYVISLNNI
jgi:hypothetical protein